MRKSVDRVALSVGGLQVATVRLLADTLAFSRVPGCFRPCLHTQVIPPMELLKFIKLRPQDEAPVIDRRRLSESLSGGRISEHDFPDHEDQFEDDDGNLDDNLTTGRRLGLLPPAPPYCDARRLYPIGNPDDFAFSGCISLTRYLINMGGTSQLGLRFGFSVGPLSIAGGFSFTPTLVVGLIGDVCLEKWKLRFGFEVRTGVAARLYISGEIAPIASAYLKLQGRALGLTFKPVMIADAKEAAVTGRFDLGIEMISLAVQAGIRFPTIKWCEGCAGCCGFDICIWYPCGWKWGGENSYEFDRISIGGDGRVRNILASLGSGRDWSPPRLGRIEMQQTGPLRASVKFADFHEDESEIQSTQFEVHIGSPGGPLAFCKAFGGAAESWSGDLTVTPVHGDLIFACITSTNTHGSSASKCAAPIKWDYAAPELQTFYTVNPATGQWRVKLPCEVYPEDCSVSGCLAGAQVDANCETRVYTNTSEILRFAVRLGARLGIHDRNGPGAEMMTGVVRRICKPGHRQPSIFGLDSLPPTE